MDSNTLLFQNRENEYYAFYRELDNGRGSLTGYYESLEGLATGMKNDGWKFKQSFRLEGGIPDIDWSQRTKDQSKLRALNEQEVNEVIEALRQ